MFTVLYMCDLNPATLEEFREWGVKEVFPWVEKQEFILHRSMRNLDLDSPHLVAYFDFEDAISWAKFWYSEEWQGFVAKFKTYATSFREYHLGPSPVSGFGFKGPQYEKSTYRA